MSLKVMISIHVPKTGGTSFRRMLEDLFGDGFQPDYDWEPRPALMDGTELQGSDDEIRAMFENGIRCVHGHFNARKYLRLREIEGIEPVFITWLRDPAERCMSTYHFLRKLDTPVDEQPEWERKAKELSLKDFFEQTRFGANRQFAQLRALDRDDLAFIGCTERFEDSARVFRHLFFPHVPDVRIEHELKNEERTGRYHIPAPLRARLVDLNVFDEQLYQYGRGWLSGALRTLPERAGHCVFSTPAPAPAPAPVHAEAIPARPESAPSFARLWQSFGRRISRSESESGRRPGQNR